MAKIWLDVEDMFEYARFNPRPSGIQRVEYELCRALARLPDAAARVGFLRHDALQKSFYTVSYSEFEALFSCLSTAAKGEQADVATPVRREPDVVTSVIRHAVVHRALKRMLYRLPPGARHPLTQIYVHQRATLAACGDLLRAGGAGLRRRITQRRRPTAPYRALEAPAPKQQAEVDGVGLRADGAASMAKFNREVQNGDVLAVLGSPWFHPDYAGLVAQAQLAGLRVAILIYDLIPIRYPEWCDRGLINPFDRWISTVLPRADVVLTISRASAADIRRYAAERGFALRTQPRVIPMGTGFTTSRAATAAESRGVRLPPVATYALIVGTIEVRKNHALLFRVWRRLLDEMPREQVPKLVFAGRVGWLVSDLMAQLRNANYLGGKIVLIEDPTDSELAQLYGGCLFSLLPSFHEGWGLPVTESLGYGRPCIIARATSLPEAGGALARYFDPDSTTDACRVIRATIEDPEDLADWHRRVEREFVPVSWDQSAGALLQAIIQTQAPALAPVVSMDQHPQK